MLIQILVDNPNSWIVPFAKELFVRLGDSGFDTVLVYSAEKIVNGDILCLLSCENIFKSLDLNIHNLVVHESDLPKGRGWSPMTWQVLEGENEIPVTLIEAGSNVDSGVIYSHKLIRLNGGELIEDIRNAQGQATIALIIDFISQYPNNIGVEQAGIATYYKRRTLEDSKLDIDKTIKEQFNLLRVVDNERYPAFFTYNGNKYKLSIERIS